MQSNPRLSANVLVISVKILVNLPVKLTTGGIRPSLVAILDLQGLRQGGLRRIPRLSRRSRETTCGFAAAARATNCIEGPITRPILTDFYRLLPIFRTFFLPPYLLYFPGVLSPGSLPSVRILQMQ
jgi:hypothetical protein